MSRLILASLVLLLAACTKKTVTECDDTFIQVDGVCVCPAGTTQVMGSCVPNDGSVPDGITTDGGPDAPSACATECTGDTPLCDEARMECVQCLLPSDCDGVAGRPMCVEGSCVACTDSSECTTPEAPVCATAGAEAGTCVACAAGSTTDCAGIEAAGVALNQCDATSGVGVCVQCTEMTAEDNCGEFSCNPATRTCTETLRGDVGGCGACVSDFECDFDGGFRCVPMEFGGEPLPGGFCLQQKDGECGRVLSTTITAESLSEGVEDEFCGVDQSSTTCAAVIAMTSGVRCPMPPGDPDPSMCAVSGALCETVDGRANVCTIPCGTATECPMSGTLSTCSITEGYCGS